jgi:hypothetical protein
MSLLQSSSRLAVEHVWVRLGEMVAEWFGDGFRLLETPAEPERRSWSYQFPMIVEQGSQRHRLVAKIPVWEEAPNLEAALGAGPQADTRAEYENLVAIAEAVRNAGDPDFTAVAPIGYVPDLNAIVTGYLPSRPMRDLLRPRAGSGLAAIFARAGRLLRLYHEAVGGLRRGPLPGADPQERLDELVGDLDRLGVIPRRLVAGIDSIRRLARHLEGSEVCVATIHHDLNLANILVAPGGRVALLDPSPEPGVAVEDLTKLVVAVRTLPRRLLSGGLVPGKGAVTSWTRALLAGYRPADREATALYRGLAVARRWVDLEPRLAGLGPMRVLARGVLAGELEDALAERW